MGPYLNLNISVVFIIVSVLLNFSHGQNTYQSYQTTIYCNASSPVLYPTNIEEVQSIVSNAIQTNQTMKAFGSRHSIADIICTDGIPMTLSNINYTIINQDGTVTVGAGAEVKDVLDFLHTQNLSLIHVPAFGGITVGGAVGTGAHGSSLLHPTSLSDQVVRLTIVDGLGNVQVISNSSTNDLRGFQVHLGLLGIIVDVTLATVPLFKMTIRNTLHPDTILTDGSALLWAQSRDWFEMWWFPSSSQVVVSQGDYLDDITIPGEHYTNMLPNVNLFEIIAGRTAYEILQATRNTSGLFGMQNATMLSLYEVPGAKPPLYTGDGTTLENPATGFAYQLMSNRCDTCAWDYGPYSMNPEESSQAFSLNQLPAVVNTVKRILSQEGTENTLFYMIGMFIRFSRASDALMAISSGRPTVTLEWTTPMRTEPFNTPKAGIAGFQAIAQAMVTEHGGRNHWGKNGPYFFNPTILEASHPNREEFIQLMRKYDPNGIFHNKFAKRLLGSSPEMDIHPNVTHCALQEYCICATNNDCGDSQVCQSLDGYMTCNDIPNLIIE